MVFELTDEHRMLRESVFQFAAKELKPIAEEIDREDRWPEGMWKKLGALGAGTSEMRRLIIARELLRV